MINLPRGQELLHVARRTLLDELLPRLPPDTVYEARMVAKAMAIAASELEKRNETEQVGTARIAAFLQASGVPPDTAPTEEALAELIRKRQLPPASLSPLHELLSALTNAKLAISNPKYLRDRQV